MPPLWRRSLSGLKMRGKNSGSKNPFGFPVPEIILLLLAALILVLILGGTIWAFATGRAKPGGDSARRDDVSATEGVEGMYRDLGTLRAPTADPAPSVVVVTPVFPYSPVDIPFREELAAKKTVLRAAITNWFHGMTRSDLSRLGEDGVKASLLELVNATLETGSVNLLYFTEYSIIE